MITWEYMFRGSQQSFPSLLFKSLTLMSVEDAQHLSGPVNIWVTLPRQQIPNQPDDPGKTKYDTSNILLAQWGLCSRIQLSYKTPLGCVSATGIRKEQNFTLHHSVQTVWINNLLVIWGVRKKLWGLRELHKRLVNNNTNLYYFHREFIYS